MTLTVSRVGDQLEGVNTPRSRAVEAQKLMKQFAEYLSPGPASSPLMHEPSQLYEEADSIQKLHLIAQELPTGGKFDKAREKIAAKYDQIERELIEEFVAAQRTDDKTRMKEIATILSHFKGYSQCIDAFIEQSQMGIFLGLTIFADVAPICAKSQTIIREVFSNPEQVMSKFVLNIYHGKIQEYVQTRLSNGNDPERYLTELHDLYSKTNKLSTQLAANKTLGSDVAFLNKLTRKIFSQYLDKYISVEITSLEDKCKLVLHRFYESKHHQKKSLPSGNFQELKRDIQAKIGRANINIANLNITMSGSENYGNETFLSEGEVAINILQETKHAFERCQLLSKSTEIANNAMEIFEIQMQYLIREHIDYALELGLQALPPAEPKAQPEIFFFEIAREANAICHLIEKQFVDLVIPLVANTPKHSECLKLKREFFEEMEVKINTGLERAISAIIGWAKFLLQTEQKKTDFKPETEDVEMMQSAVSGVVDVMS